MSFGAKGHSYRADRLCEHGVPCAGCSGFGLWLRLWQIRTPLSRWVSIGLVARCRSSRLAACGDMAKLTLVASRALSLRKERTRWLVSLAASRGTWPATGRGARLLAARVRAICPSRARALLEVKAVLLLGVLWLRCAFLLGVLLFRTAAPALGVGPLLALTLDTRSRFSRRLSLSIRSLMQRIRKSYDLLGSSSRQRSYASMS